MKTQIIYGLGIGAAWFAGNLLNSILLFQGDLVKLTGIVVASEWLIAITGVWLGIRKTRESTDEKSISWLKGLITGLMISVYWGISSSILALVYTIFFVKIELIRQIISLSVDYNSVSRFIPMNWNLSNGIEAGMYFARIYIDPLVMVISFTILNIIEGTGVSLVLAAFLKRRIFGRRIANNNIITLCVVMVISALLVSSCSPSRSKPHDLFMEPVNSPIKVGSAPNSIAVGDFNGDGKPDLAIPNAGNNNITILLGNRTGGFTQSKGSPFKVGMGPSAVAVGDFNGDGKTDLAISNVVSNNVSILLGNGFGSFAEVAGCSPFKVGAQKWWLGGPEWPASLVVGDFNGDGKLDLAIAVVKDNIVKIMLGNGFGGFSEAPGSPCAVGTNPWALAVGDFNGDGRPDLAVPNAENNNVTILLGNGNGGFYRAPGSPFPVGSYPRSVVIRDFNEDGKPDLAILNAKSENVTVLLGTGSGGFIEAAGSPFILGSIFNPITHGTWPFCAAAGDFNMDGKLDLAVSNTNNIVTVLLGNGTGGFSEAPDSPFGVGSSPKWVVVSDFNMDGKPDLAIANRDDDNVTILLNNYSGSWKVKDDSVFSK
jgi:hypothetical protein